MTLPPDAAPSPSESDTASDSGGCAMFCFMLVWTVVTLSFDCFVAYGLLREFSGEAVYFVLFSVPFNAVMIVGWLGMAAKGALPKRSFQYLEAGISVRDEGDLVRFRLPRITPIAAAFLTSFVISITLGVGIGVTTLGKPNFFVATGALVLVFVATLAAYVIVAGRIAAGKTDLIVDRLRGTLILPQTFGREEPIFINCGDLAEISVEAEKKTDNDGGVYWTYFVIGQWRAAGSEIKREKLAELKGKAVAEELANGIRRAAMGGRAAGDGDGDTIQRLGSG